MPSAAKLTLSFWNRPAHIYAVRALSGDRKGQVKIGHSRQPDKRFLEIASEPDVNGGVEVLWTTFAPRRLEVELQEWFGDQWVSREWFVGDDDMATFFAALPSEDEVHRVVRRGREDLLESGVTLPSVHPKAG